MNKTTASLNYDEEYYERQIKNGKLTGERECHKFYNSMQESDTVVDFGCGGGFLLAKLECKNKYGIEPNTSAHEDARLNGITIFSNTKQCVDELGESSVDAIISNHALEHTLSPLDELKALHPLLKQGGRIHFVVPFEAISNQWKENDLNFHLYTWSPLNLGNLFVEAGYKPLIVRPIKHRWPPAANTIANKFGPKFFHLSSKIWGHIYRKVSQVEIIAEKI